MKAYLRGEIHQRFATLKYKWLPFHLVGIRSKADVPNSFDDQFYLINELDMVHLISWQTSCTTNPGLYWMQKVMNKKGAAVLKPGQYIDTWKLGKHKNVHEALVQAAPVTVYRDNNKNDKAEENGLEDTGMFGINIHRANNTAISKIIDQWSAGCIVLNSPVEFNRLLQDCKVSGLSKFTFTLLREWD
jgi:hypothetical protein